MRYTGSYKLGISYLHAKICVFRISYLLLSNNFGYKVYVPLNFGYFFSGILVYDIRIKLLYATAPRL